MRGKLFGMSNSRRKTAAANSSPSVLENIEFLVDNYGDITIGAIGPIRRAATAADEDQWLAMAVRRPDESQLLQRLDAAIADAFENNVCVDEINAPLPHRSKPSARGEG